MNIFLSKGRGNRIYEVGDLESVPPYEPTTPAARFEHIETSCSRPNVFDVIKPLSGRDLPKMVNDANDPEIDPSLHCVYIENGSLKLILPAA